MNKYQAYPEYQRGVRVWIVYNTEDYTAHSTHNTYESAYATCSVLNSGICKNPVYYGSDLTKYSNKLA